MVLLVKEQWRMVVQLQHGGDSREQKMNKEGPRGKLDGLVLLYRACTMGF